MNEKFGQPTAALIVAPAEGLGPPYSEIIKGKLYFQILYLYIIFYLQIGYLYIIIIHGSADLDILRPLVAK